MHVFKPQHTFSTPRQSEDHLSESALYFHSVKKRCLLLCVAHASWSESFQVLLYLVSTYLLLLLLFFLSPFNLRFKLCLTTIFCKMKKINGLCKIFLMKFSLQSLILIRSPQYRTLMEKSNLTSSVGIKLSDPSHQPVSSFLLLITLRWLESLVYSKQF